MRYTFINTNQKAVNDKLIEQGIYKNHHYYIKQVNLGEFHWYCCYIEVLSTDKNFKYIIDNGSESRLSNITITFNGHVMLGNTELESYYIGFDTQDAFLQYLNIDEYVEMIKDTIDQNL